MLPDKIGKGNFLLLFGDVFRQNGIDLGGRHHSHRLVEKREQVLVAFDRSEMIIHALAGGNGRETHLIAASEDIVVMEVAENGGVCLSVFDGMQTGVQISQPYRLPLRKSLLQNLLI